VAWLVRDGIVLASAEIAGTRRTRRAGLLGRNGFEGFLVLRPCRQVHTVGMRFPIDVAWCAGDGEILRIAELRPGRVSRVVWRSRFVIEAQAGAFERWKLAAGDVVEVHGAENYGGSV
jgi:uncharacterized membrane protein (UPF0127 family)